MELSRAGKVNIRKATGKRAGAIGVGEPVVLNDINTPKTVCHLPGCNNELKKRCVGCHVVGYCSKSCQQQDWAQHKQLCIPIQTLGNKNSVMSVDFKELKGNQAINPKCCKKLTKLVGDKCLVPLHLEGEFYKVLWDTGAQVSLVNSDWLSEHFPKKEVKSLEELVESSLVVKSASGNVIGLRGWVSMEVCPVGSTSYWTL